MREGKRRKAGTACIEKNEKAVYAINYYAKTALLAHKEVLNSSVMWQWLTLATKSVVTKRNGNG